MGSLVTIVEVDPIAAIEALMDGYQVMNAADAAAWGQVFITATGNLNVFRREHFGRMQDGAILANSGHFDAELELKALAELAGGRIREVRQNVQEYLLEDGRRLHVVAEGRLVNLGAAEGHPAAVMDMSFAGQALSAEYAVVRHAELSAGVHTLPAEVDREIARLKLEELGVRLDPMTTEQERYVNSWQEGT
jgi:adenosylhomocysteinase